MCKASSLSIIMCALILSPQIDRPVSDLPSPVITSYHEPYNASILCPVHNYQLMPWKNVSAASVPRWGFASYARGLMMSPSYCASWGWSSLIVIVTLTAKLLPNGPGTGVCKGVGRIHCERKVVSFWQRQYECTVHKRR